MGTRRNFLKHAGILTTSALISFKSNGGKVLFHPSETLLKPLPLKTGDTIAIIAPGGAVFNQNYVSQFKTVLINLGYKTIVGKTCRLTDGQFAGTAVQRAEELMDFISQPNVKAIVAMRGGSGCAQILPLLNYEIIAKNPKIIMGFSDLTSLINAIYSQANVVGFHGPVGYSSWGSFTLNSFKAVTRNGKATHIFNQHPETKRHTISSGQAVGRIVGGNLTVFSRLIGTPYMPNCTNCLLVLEEIDEEPYAIDRMLTHLKQAGILTALSGIVLGNFKRCNPEEPERSHSLTDTFNALLKPLDIPVFSGADFGHTTHKWTIPIGCRAKMDADKCTLELLESAVSMNF